MIGDYSRVTNYLLERGLDVSMIRQEVISDNIANVDVPNFKRSDVAFEQEMIKALESQQKPRYQAYMTHSRHIPFYQPIPVESVRPNLQVDHYSSMREDGNNVDIDRESADALRNTLQYRALADMVSQNFKMLKISMRA